jgi:uncharacterized RDD family membrane protein YckC
MPGPTPAYASFWRRVGARVIDILIISVAAAVLGAATLADDFSEAIADNQVDRLEVFLRGGKFLTFAALVGLAAAIYEIALVATRGATLGKMALGLKVTRVEDGALPTWGQAFIRWLVPAAASYVPRVGGLIVLVIYLWMLWDPDRRNQGLHDKAARTVVIVAR